MTDQRRALGEFGKEKAFSWAGQGRASSPKEELTEDPRDELGELDRAENGEEKG